MEVGGELYLYHEKQDAGLCAVHAMNALLQGPYFSEVDLAHIAREFDEKEKQVMMEMGMETPEFLKYMAVRFFFNLFSPYKEDSGNVAEDGNYSVQVIAKALSVWNLQAFPITSPEMQKAKQNPLTEEAYICNLASHWLTIRKLGGEYWNLNSLLSEPQYLSDFYLSAFLDTLMMKGYTVFVIRGDLPKIPVSMESLREGPWKKVNRKRKASSQAVEEDADLQAALEASQLEAAIKMSLQPNSPKVLKQENVSVEDEELLAAIQLSQQLAPKTDSVAIEAEPPKSSDTTDLSFRLADGSRVDRRFLKSAKIESLYAFLKQHGVEKGKHKLISTYPRNEYEDVSVTLEAVGLYPTGVVTVVPR